MTNNFTHVPVLLKETIDSIIPSENLLSSIKQTQQNKIYIIDATIGGAGHASYLIEKFHTNSMYNDFFLHLIGIDQDTSAIVASNQKLKTLKNTFPRFDYKLFHANFSELQISSRGLTAGSSEFTRSENLDREAKPWDNKFIHGLYADFGVSSPQLDTEERGFSFMSEGPLDMRMNTQNPLTAAKILLTYPESELSRVFFEYGEEPKSRILSRAIIMDRNLNKLPIENTKVFAEYVKKILKYGYSRTNPATRIFQALRIEVNGELDAIQNLLTFVPTVMCSNAKAGFISFHSLEDRLVKRTMRLWQMKELGRENPRGGIVPHSDETSHNPRARSARLRVFDFIA